MACGKRKKDDEGGTENVVEDGRSSKQRRTSHRSCSGVEVEDSNERDEIVILDSDGEDLESDSDEMILKELEMSKKKAEREEVEKRQESINTSSSHHSCVLKRLAARLQSACEGHAEVDHFIRDDEVVTVEDKTGLDSFTPLLRRYEAAQDGCGDGKVDAADGLSEDEVIVYEDGFSLQSSDDGSRRIKLMLQDSQGHNLEVGMGTHAPFKALKNKFWAVAIERSWNPDKGHGVRLMFDDEELRDDQTPVGVDMETDDKIDVYYLTTN